MMSSAIGLDALAAGAVRDQQVEESLEDVSAEIEDLAALGKGSGKVEMAKTFEFGVSSITAGDLDDYSGLGWFARN